MMENRNNWREIVLRSFFSSKKAIIIPIVLAGLGVFLLTQYLKTKESELGLSAELTRIIVSKVDIPAYSKLDRTMFTTIKVPRKFLQPSVITEIDSIDRRVNLVPILKGVQILETMLASKRQSIGLALKITKGHRAVSVGVDPVSAVSGLIRPGDTVDVLGTFKFDLADENGQQLNNLEKRTFTLLQNLIVLAVGKDMGMESMVNEAKKSKTTKDLEKRMSALRKSKNVRKKRQKLTAVTLLASPEQVQKLVLGQAVGALTLALRPAVEDEEFSKVKPLDAKRMLGIKDTIYMPRPWRATRGTDRD
jgi:pilus assembly protein CpaB